MHSTASPALEDRHAAVAAGGPVRLADRAREALLRARAQLLRVQALDGSWCAELEGDSILVSEYVLTQWFLGRQGSPRVRKAAETLRRRQRPDGAWSLFPGGPDELSASVKAYFVLKLSGDAPDAPHMERARRSILALGGLEATNSYTKIYLAIFGQYPWEGCPAIPPELVLFPSWFPFNLYEMSSWSRAIVVPLCLIWAKRPHVTVPERASIAELCAAASHESAGVVRFVGRHPVWTRVFGAADRLLKSLERLRLRPLRRLAMRRAEAWIRERLAGCDGVGAIFPPIVNTIVGFSALGYPVDEPVVASQIAELERLGIEDDETFRVQPCFSALWDTAQVLSALLGAGVAPDDPAVLGGARWLLAREVRRKGDWAVKVRGVPAGGWYFEYRNEWYPDCDDTAEVLGVLARVRFPDPDEDARRTAAIERGLAWLLGMQSPTGGWAAFDRAVTKRFLTYVPFADHNAMLDPPVADVTGRALAALAHAGVPQGHRAVRRAVRFLRREEEEDGTWFGRWGANYVYGTWLALTGLVRSGEDPDAPWVRRSAGWLQDRQNPDGGWGESLRSYDEPALKGRGESTAAQTAWALLGLLALGPAGDPARASAERRGVERLLATQLPDGSWFDESFTGTGFPRVFYLRYHLYATLFPALALATWLDVEGASPADRPASSGRNR